MRSFALARCAAQCASSTSAAISEKVADIHCLAGVRMLLEELHRAHDSCQVVRFFTVLRRQAVVREASRELAEGDPLARGQQHCKQHEQLRSELEEAHG